MQTSDIQRVGKQKRGMGGIRNGENMNVLRNSIMIVFITQWRVNWTTTEQAEVNKHTFHQNTLQNGRLYTFSAFVFFSFLWKQRAVPLCLNNISLTFLGIVCLMMALNVCFMLFVVTCYCCCVSNRCFCWKYTFQSNSPCARTEKKNRIFRIAHKWCNSS